MLLNRLAYLLCVFYLKGRGNYISCDISPSECLLMICLFFSISFFAENPKVLSCRWLFDVTAEFSMETSQIEDKIWCWKASSYGKLQPFPGHLRGDAIKGTPGFGITPFKGREPAVKRFGTRSSNHLWKIYQKTHVLTKP